MDNFQIMLPAIISSTVLAALVSSVVGLVQNRRTNRLERITDERKKWREELRDFAAKFQNEKDFEKAKDLLVELKVRINAYGIEDRADYLADAHIWDLIKSFEECNGSEIKEQMKFKERIILAISCLLKFDWERSKREVMTNKSSIICVAVYLISLTALTYLFATSVSITLSDFFEVPDLMDCLISAFMFMFFLFMFSFLPPAIDFNKDEILAYFYVGLLFSVLSAINMFVFSLKKKKMLLTYYKTIDSILCK